MNQLFLIGTALEYIYISLKYGPKKLEPAVTRRGTSVFSLLLLLCGCKKIYPEENLKGVGEGEVLGKRVGRAGCEIPCFEKVV